PVFMIESGPAAGVIASHALARAQGILNAITFDMGGTTAKASIIENGALNTAAEYEVGSALSLVSRLIKGGGHLIRVPAIDVAEVGAGGGSIAWLDAGGALHIGPRSAGAAPGPVCYDQGGAEVTSTDANLVLGYINSDGLVGGGMPLHRAKAEEALRRQVAEPMGMTLMEAAYGVHLLANSSMMRAVRAVSTERGRDLRDYVLIAFGGGGPLHACEMARSLEMKEAVIPPPSPASSAPSACWPPTSSTITSRRISRRLRKSTSPASTPRSRPSSAMCAGCWPPKVLRPKPSRSSATPTCATPGNPPS
ncbi:MAG: hypothetical protein FJW37_10705, partial [Acidobacteria bacterium]|nr:hypothetical protein [Acidobacteriota bacterium]